MQASAVALLLNLALVSGFTASELPSATHFDGTYCAKYLNVAPDGSMAGTYSLVCMVVSGGVTKMANYITMAGGPMSMPVADAYAMVLGGPVFDGAQGFIPPGAPGFDYFSSEVGEKPPSLEISAEGAVVTMSLGPSGLYTMLGAPPLDDLAPFSGSPGPLAVRTPSHPGAASEKPAYLVGEAVFDAGATKMCYEKIPTFTSDAGVTGYEDFAVAYTKAQTGDDHCWYRVA